MKNVLSLLALLFVAVLSLAGSSQKKLDGSPALDKIADAHPDWDLADIIKRSPVCDCEGKCKCAEPCLCNVVDEQKPADLQVADVRAIHVPAEIKAPPVYTAPPINQQPVIRKYPPKPTPRVPAGKPMPAAVSQPQYGSCGPGGCGRRGLFGRRR